MAMRSTYLHADFPSTSKHKFQKLVYKNKPRTLKYRGLLCLNKAD